MLQRFQCLLIGYAFGCILTAEIVSFCKSHQSMRTMGSGNPGMTNALRIYGKKYGFIVLAGDLLKTVAACLLAQYFLGSSDYSLSGHLAMLYAGLGTVLGHNFPFWNGFHGGKGVACTCMALFCFSPILGLASCLIGLTACLITRYLAIGGTLIPAVFLVFTFFAYTDWEVYLLAFLIFLLMLQRSFASLERIVRGQEERSLWSAPKQHTK